MPITFDEVTAEVAPAPAAQQTGAAAPPAAPEPLHDQLVNELRLLAERGARLSDQ